MAHRLNFLRNKNYYLHKILLKIKKKTNKEIAQIRMKKVKSTKCGE